MKRLKIAGTIAATLALGALSVYSSDFGAALRLSAPTGIAHGVTPPPDDGTGNILTAHGVTPPPDDGTGNILTAHGVTPPPDDGTGNILMAHGVTPPPDDGTGNIQA
jgi:hypothetical protein